MFGHRAWLRAARREGRATQTHGTHNRTDNRRGAAQRSTIATAKMRKDDGRRRALSVLSRLSPGVGIAAGCGLLAAEDSGARSAAIREQTSPSPG
jgi:hypothetical protein